MHCTLMSAHTSADVLVAVTLNYGVVVAEPLTTARCHLDVSADEKASNISKNTCHKLT